MKSFAFSKNIITFAKNMFEEGNDMEEKKDIGTMKYPLGVQTFEKMRNGGCVYIDKTEMIYKMVTEGCYYFLGRPRRFGKSLLVSTLEAYFSGKKELFEDLAIYEMETKWEKYPVFHLNFAGENYQQPDALEKKLNKFLKQYEAEYDIPYEDDTLSGRFETIIQKASEKTEKQVVILVDEYDKPILDLLGHEEIEETNRAMLKAFYGVMKSQDEYIRFGFLTGVTKLGKVSVFSDLNNITDVSLSDDYATICGVTEEELHNVFDDEVEAMAQKGKMTKEECYAKLAKQYDGYHFGEDVPGVYNPYSLLRALSDKKFGDYWFETGTPTHLIKILNTYLPELPDLSDIEVPKDGFGAVESYKTDILPLLYQSGYLTLRQDCNDEYFYYLKFPNREVETGFVNRLIPLYTSVAEEKSKYYIGWFAQDLRKGDVDMFLKRMKTFFDGGDYRLAGDKEVHFHNCFTIVCRLLGLACQAESANSNGRCDLIVQTSKFVYVIEFKHDGSAEEALKQINDKDYAKPFALDDRKLYKIGINFSSELRSINEWKIEER